LGDALHQMTAEYNPAEDRILFRVNTVEKTEYRVWLTRRLVRQIWGVAVQNFAAEPDVKEQERPQVKKAVLSMQHQEAVQGADFSQKHQKPDKAAAETEQPLLAINAELGKTEQGAIRLSFHTSAGRSINLNLNDEMLHAVCHILQQAADKAGWDLKLAIGDAARVITPTPAQLH
jgi:hypothetical protein